MHPYSQIVSRTREEFPMDAFRAYPALMLVDWREAETTIAEQFFNATGLPSAGTEMVWDDQTEIMSFVHEGRAFPITRGEGASAQHSTLLVLQQVYGNRHSIRYLNHVTAGDWAYYAVETPATWKQLEEQYPLVRWFFTPIAFVPDVFASAYEELEQAGRSYAEGKPVLPAKRTTSAITPESRDAREGLQSSLQQTTIAHDEEAIQSCRTRFRPPPRVLDALDAQACRLQLSPDLMRALTRARDPLLCVLTDHAALCDRGQIVWGALVQGNNLLFDRENRLTAPANVVYSLDPYFDGRPLELLRLAHGLFAQKGGTPADQGLGEFVQTITDETTAILRRELPRNYCGGRSVYFATCFVQPSHLPRHFLAQSTFPLLVNFAETPAVMLLPSRYWPATLASRWR